MRMSRGAAGLGIATVLFTAGCRTIPSRPTSNAAGRVADVRLVGFDVLLRDEQKRLQNQLPLKPGAPFTDAVEQSAGTMAVDALQNQGYPYAQVQITREPAAAGLVRFIVTALAGRPGFFGRTEI